ncbi:MAG TPA: RidA family protein [Paracoccaceae bacterium]|nr:RidA family protein [Paracoccaceae bacterium]
MAEKFKALQPTGIPAPVARYSHGISVAAGARLVFTAGQLGIRPDGSVPSDATGQARQCFANILAILAADGMGPEHVVRINAYVTDQAYLQAYMTARDELYAGKLPPASTLVIVQGLARPEFLVEIEAVAAAF